LVEYLPRLHWALLLRSKYLGKEAPKALLAHRFWIRKSRAESHFGMGRGKGELAG